MTFNVYIGWDEREQDAYSACVESLRTNTKGDIQIRPLKLHDLQASRSIYRQEFFSNEVVSTGFAFTRFLTPYLNGYQGWALFIDCDFIFTKGLEELWALRDDKYSVMCVQHDYTPAQTIKMDGCKQTAFPRKNWSSLMLFNCSHVDCLNLNPNTVSAGDPAFLHQMKWTDDKSIGQLSTTWNWLVGEYDKPTEDFIPNAIHFTNGCPSMPGYEHCDYADEFLKYYPKNGSIRDGH